MGTRSARRSPNVTNATLGLQQLGLRPDSDASVLHEWSQRLPAGMFDGHGSVLPAPDHLIFHGLARCCLKTLFKALPKEHKPVVAASLRDALRESGLRRTRVYSSRRDKVISLQIHEWAAVLSVAPVACRRCLPSHLGAFLLASSPVGAVLAVIDALSAFASLAYFYPRAELDGGKACRERYNTETLEHLAESFLSAVRKLCLRPDCDAFSSIMDVPNTHRFHEMMFRTIEALGHIRDSLELPLEGFHQTLKRSIVRGNGHDDALRAMRRYVEQEVVSRVSMSPSAFGVPQDWYEFPGVKEQLRAAAPLWSQESDDWCAGSSLSAESDVPMLARELIVNFLDGHEPSWRTRCSRGASESVVVGDALAVLVSSDSGSRVVDVAVGVAAFKRSAAVSFFRACAFIQLPCGQAAAVVEPFRRTVGGDVHRVVPGTCLFLRMRTGVRRAVALHVCDGACALGGLEGLTHSGSNKWRLLGRRDGYPSRSA